MSTTSIPPTKIDYERYTNLAFHRRGALINETIMLERIMDNYIAEYFCPNDEKKAIQLLELIISTKRMVFENKVQVFRFLYEEKYADFFKKNNLFAETLKVIDDRNIFAHYWLVTSNELTQFIKENKTVFLKFQNTSSYITYDNLSFIISMTRIADCIKMFQEFQKLKKATEIADKEANSQESPKTD